MKSFVVLGAGTGGTTIANRMRRRLDDSWNVTVVDPDPIHLYQPALLFIPFGGRTDGAIAHHRARTLRRGIDWIQHEVEGVDPAARRVSLAGGMTLGYDLLVIATGARLRPDLTPGLPQAMARGEAYDVYTLGAKYRVGLTDDLRVSLGYQQTEADLDYALKFSQVDPLPHDNFHMVNSKMVDALKQRSANRIGNSDFFKKVTREIGKYKEMKEKLRQIYKELRLNDEKSELERESR